MEAAMMNVSDIDRALGLAGGGDSEAPGAVPDLLLGAVLSGEEIARTLTSPDSAPDLFVEAVRYAAELLRRRGERAFGSSDRGRELVAGALRNPVARLPEAAGEILPEVLEFGLHSGGHFRSLAKDFFEKADFPPGFAGEAARREIARGGARRLSLLAEMCAERASSLRKRSREAEEEVAALVAAVEEIVLGGEGREDWPSYGSLEALLVTLYPVMSLPLLDRQIARAGEPDPVTKALPFPKHGLRFYELFELPEFYEPSRVERLLRLDNPAVDNHLCRNPALEPHEVWALYARYSRRDARDAGRRLALRREVIDFLVAARAGAALKGAIPVLTKNKLTRKMLTDEGARVAYEACLAEPSEEDEATAAVAYSRLGDEAGETLLKLKIDAIARGVVRQWCARPADGKTLAAVLAYPRKSVRRFLLDRAETLLLEKPGAAELYRDRILPAFASDRSPELAEAARRLQALIAEKEGDVTRRLRYVTADELAVYAAGDESIPAGHFDLLLARAEELDAPAVLKKLAFRVDLTLDQYRRLAALSDELAATAARRAPESLPGVKEFLAGLKDAGSPAVLVSLAGRAEWDEFERYLFLTHRLEVVRAALARNNTRLCVREVADLLCDQELSVREALVRNPAWASYAEALRSSASGAAPRPHPD